MKNISYFPYNMFIFVINADIGSRIICYTEIKLAPSTRQILAIDQELLDSIRLIRSGFGQLQQLNGANDFYHMPLLTLSSGFERFLKVVLCFRHLEIHGDFPDVQDLPSGRKGHDLEFLLEQVLIECFLPEYLASIPVAKIDYEYLKSEQLRTFIRVLGRFGQAARYYYLDVVLGRTPDTDPPDREWESLESAIFVSRPKLLKELVQNPDSNKVFVEVSTEVVTRLERLARAVARLFTIGKIGEVAIRYTSYIGSFLFLDDEDLGKNVYSPFGSSV